MVAEMHKFRKRLSEKEVGWWDESENGIDCTKLVHNGVLWSVVNGFGTYGGCRRDKPNEGLLEIFDGTDDEMGWLTADDAIQIIFEGEDV